MSFPALFAVPADIVLALSYSSSDAQDKPSSTTVSKPVTTLSKSAKQKPAASPQDATVRTVKQGTETQTAPSATQTTPVSERTYEGCHHSKDSDA